MNWKYVFNENIKRNYINNNKSLAKNNLKIQNNLFKTKGWLFNCRYCFPIHRFWLVIIKTA